MRIFLMLLLAATLSACASDPVKRQPEVQVEVVTHQMSVDLCDNKLSEADKQAISGFIYRLGTPSSLRVRVDTHSRHGRMVLPAVKEQLKHLAVYPSQISEQYQPASKGNKADLTLVVELYRSVIQRCYAGKEPNIVLNRYQSSSNFGCANASALAQMVVNPRDLVVGSALEPTEGRKAVSAVESYYGSGSKGEFPGSKGLSEMVSATGK